MADYLPERGPKIDGIDFTHGIIQREHNGVTNTAGRAIARRLATHGGTLDCYDHELLLPRWAPDCLRDIAPLVAAYEKQLLPGQADLLGIATVRFPPSEPFHRQWEAARSWARSSFNARDLAAILIHHVPALAGRQHKSHIHILYPVRVLHGTFGAFVALDRATLAAEWWRHLAAGDASHPA